MRYADALGQVIAGAVEGSEAYLGYLRSLFDRAGAAGQKRLFRVSSDQLLCDAEVSGPRRRRDVFARFERFATSTPALSGLSVSVATAQVRRCPALARVFQSAALAHVGAIQMRLVLDPTLQPADRRRIQHELTQLLAPGRSIWENWISTTEHSNLHQFDQLAQRWLDGPLDLDEQLWFKEGWRARRYDIESASRFFSHLPLELRLYFGIELAQQPELAASPDYALRGCTVEEANRRAALLGSQVQFQSQATATA